jgi:subtilisin
MADFDGKPGGRARPECRGADVGPAGFADDAAAPFSNFAATRRDYLHTIAAPGFCMETTVPPGLGLGDYAKADGGTSLSAPAVAGVMVLCIADGRCRPGRPVRNLLTLQADTTLYNVFHPQYGYDGDPFTPTPGRFYDFLARAGARTDTGSVPSRGPAHGWEHDALVRRRPEQVASGATR